MFPRLFNTFPAILAGVAAMAAMGATDAVARENRIPGFYAGIFGGIAVLDSTVVFTPTGARADTIKLVDQGGDGAVVGFRAGWGTMISRHGYAGLEADLLVPIGVTSRVNAAGVEYRDRLRNEFGVYGRIGWSPERNSLFFLRAGVSIPRQSFDNVPGGTRETWSVAPAIGLGAETHVTRRVAARIDATYSWPTGDNRMESYRMTAGLAWRF